MSVWKRVSDWCIRSKDGRFTVCKYGTAEGWRYECWDGKQCIAAYLMTADEAKRKCEERE
jgi:hypothetical protein